jgi:hypothetical protein
MELWNYGVMEGWRDVNTLLNDKDRQLLKVGSQQ